MLRVNSCRIISKAGYIFLSCIAHFLDLDPYAARKDRDITFLIMMKRFRRGKPIF